MVAALDQKQTEQEVVRATRLARKVKRPKGVHVPIVVPDENYEGRPLLVISVEIDDPDDVDPTTERLDELIDYDRAVTSRILGRDFAGWPVVRFIPRRQ